MYNLRRDLSNSERHEFFLMVWLSWLVTAATAAVVLLACYVSNFKFVPTLIPINLVAAFFGLMVFVAYVLFRNDFFILSISNAVATISAFSSAGAILSYVAMHYSFSFHLWDATLASTDKLFRLDWYSLLRWVDAHRSIADILSYAYVSFVQQAVGVVIILSLLGEYRRLQTLILAFQICALSCAAIAAFMPAVGEYAYLKINPAIQFQWLPSFVTSYVADVIQLRTDAPFIPLDGFKGVITFPSFHSALGFLFFWAFWRTPVVRWIAFILNATMVAATPIFGGHYFVDVGAGLLVAFGSVLIARRVVKRIQLHINGGGHPILKPFKPEQSEQNTD